jgi:hypothetical protein
LLSVEIGNPELAALTAAGSTGDERRTALSRPARAETGESGRRRTTA